MENNRILLGFRIKEIRKARNLSQEQLSDAVGISPKHLSRIEMGNGYPSLDTLDKIATNLKAELKDFFDFDAYKNDLITTETITQLFDNLDETQKRLILKVIKCLG